MLARYHSYLADHDIAFKDLAVTNGFGEGPMLVTSEAKPSASRSF
jgi:hypothetical protein